MIYIRDIRLYPVTLDLKTPFVTHFGKVDKRKSLILEVIDESGLHGFGESVAFESPWYTEETCSTAQSILEAFLIPQLIGQSFLHPRDLQARFQSIKRHAMAKAAIDMAIWDLYAQQKQLPLSRCLGGMKNQLDLGVVLGLQSISDLINQIETFQQQGYRHFKLKIAPGHDLRVIEAVREQYPDLSLMVDANGAYEQSDMKTLQALDSYALRLIEQPFGEKQLLWSAKLQDAMQTKIGLDESITSIEDARLAIELRACRAMSIKIGRLGGITSALELMEYAKSQQISLWCGGTLESGIGRAHALALASLEHFDLPIEFSDSSRYWEHDIIEPILSANRGTITLSNQFGLGHKLKIE
jgi:O-succinylbenzoate synthase